MNAELQSVRDRIERQLTDYAVEAVKIGKIALIRGVMKLVGDVDTPDSSSVSIPRQHTYSHDTLKTEQQLEKIDVLDRCAVAFNSATAMQMDTGDTLLKPSTVYGLPSEYMALSGPRKAKLFLHRPAIDSESDSHFPYWFGEETVSNDPDTGLPTLHYRETVVDKLGNLQSREWIEGKKQVIRPLEAYEAVPYLEVLHSIVIHPIVGMTEKADSK